MGEKKPDFSGYATKSGIKCTDGRTIMPDAFKHQDGLQVPLVWHHGHADVKNVLGHTILRAKDGDVYCEGFFNETEQGKAAKEMVRHEDINSLSIYANQLKETALNVMHGFIREVSLVMAGANPGAVIDNISIAHAEGGVTIIEDEAIITTGLAIAHGDKPLTSVEAKAALEHAEDEDGPTVQEVYDGMDDDQKNVVHYMIGAALEGAHGEVTHSALDKPDLLKHEEGTTRMNRNVFEAQKGGGSAENNPHALSHDALKGIAADALKNNGNLKHALEAYALQHGIESIELLFPDAKAITNTPEFDSRRMEWVRGVLNGTRHTPFSRIKSLSADITQEEARAKGYIKGSFKKEEWFGLTKRTTGPATIYKKQKLDRDDILDITEMDVVMWLWGEMRLMLEEELARAILIGDGRDIGDEDKVKDPAGAQDGMGIRSILNEPDLYAATVNVNINDANSDYTEVIDQVLRSMRLYKGSGNPTLFTTEVHLVEMLLLKDDMNRRLYRNVQELAAEMRVSNIVAVEVMESVPDLIGIIVNLNDYTIGTDKGGDITKFDDFDIDYNQYKYLLETRLSGALVKLRSALIIKKAASTAVLTVPTSPTFVENTGVITIPSQTGVTFKRKDTNVTVSAGAMTALAAGAKLTIYAVPTNPANNYFADNVHDEWTFKRPSA